MIIIDKITIISKDSMKVPDKDPPPFFFNKLIMFAEQTCTFISILLLLLIQLISIYILNFLFLNLLEQMMKRENDSTFLFSISEFSAFSHMQSI